MCSKFTTNMKTEIFLLTKLSLDFKGQFFGGVGIFDHSNFSKMGEQADADYLETVKYWLIYWYMTCQY